MGEQAHGLDGQPRDRARGRAGKETPSRREPQTSFIQLDRRRTVQLPNRNLTVNDSVQ